jgi:ATP synthase protein I
MIEPERDLVRRAAPIAIPVAGVAFALGALVGGRGAGWSAALGVAVVAANFAAHGLSLAWAARISPTIMFAVGLGGYLVRIALVVLLLIALNSLSWFSPVAFLAAVVPATTLLLGFEMKVVSGRMQADLWRFPSEGAK